MKDIIKQIVKISELLHDDIRYDKPDAEMRLRQLETLSKSLEILVK